MSWREILGVSRSTYVLNTHNSQNTHKSAEPASSADSADFALKESENEHSVLLETLATACREVDITPIEVMQALAPGDISNLRQGLIGVDTLTHVACSLVERREMNQGKRPSHYTERATCKHCGPVWLWISDEVLGCPWCWNRVAARPIPRPCSVRCGECLHFRRKAHPYLGHCNLGEPEAVGGLCDSDLRYCERFLPSPEHRQNE